MTETITLTIDPLLLERVRRLAAGHGWSEAQVFAHLLEHGLFACEAELAARFSDSDDHALQAAIAALEKIQDDPGFANIGRLGVAEAEALGPVPWPSREDGTSTEGR